MPGYNDETLLWGASEGHAPMLPEDCTVPAPYGYAAGDEDDRESALKANAEFSAYAKSLVSWLSTAP